MLRDRAVGGFGFARNLHGRHAAVVRIIAQSETAPAMAASPKIPLPSFMAGAPYSVSDPQAQWNQSSFLAPGQRKRPSIRRSIHAITSVA
jgi:hypothetical protein